jgi:hypothetical protein
MTQRLIFTSTPPVPTNSRLSLPLFCAQKRKTKSKPSSEQTDLQIEKEKKEPFGLHPDILMPESAKVP